MEPQKDGCGHPNPYGNDKYDGSNSKKFLYRGTKHRSDPWGSENPDNSDLIKPKSGHKNNKRANNSPGFDLDNVWSIRKNVQVSNSVKNGTALKANNKSFYSRHGGFPGNGELESSSLSKRQKTDDFINHSTQYSDTKTWSVNRSSYSYSDSFGGGGDTVSPLRDVFGDPLEGSNNIVLAKNKLNSKLHMPGAPQIASREMSARTKKAHNLHQAHLRSSGLGQFTPGMGQNQEDNAHSWEGDDFFGS
ncbi:uncharacterized protein LOC5504717 [Nematostella vectensis]|uniref:uncharacterized protein LOC5504717 n=1 Tax=Nematostella vectensis TaxID=45351 RepID=UPI0020774A9F|nr:uncharacterized protein LOC5504717 [Nematostella vectensis]